jgi:hypothetical protein
MESPENEQERGDEEEFEFSEEKSLEPVFSSDILHFDTWKRFFSMTGGSLFYCLSAAFVSYGVVKLLGPVLAESKSLSDAFACIFTLHIYELALLGVLILIVCRKVVDDAISLVMIMGLFLVGTSMVQGSVSDMNTKASLFLGLGGVGIALGKFYLMRRFVRIPFGMLCMVGLGILMVYNYLGPVLLAYSITVDPSHELIRRNQWLLVYLCMLAGVVLVIIEAMRVKLPENREENKAVPFLQRPVMVYIFALLLVALCGIHQYTMAFIFTLERGLGDYVPVFLVGSLLLIEIMRHCGKRFGIAEFAVSCVPFAVTMLAIYEKAFIDSGEIGPGLLCYPPAILLLSGSAVAVLALYHRWYPLLAVSILYGLGVVLTAGFTPEYPHDLNIKTCVGLLICALIIYGIIVRMPYICIAGIVVLCIGLGSLDSFPSYVEPYQLTDIGANAGLCGLGFMLIYLIFGKQLHKAVPIIGSLCLAGFIFDYLPANLDWRYMTAFIGMAVIATLMWLRTKEIVGITILCMPFLIRLYILAKYLAQWRLVILGFMLLGIGTIVSLFKSSKENKQNLKEDM